MDGRSGAHRHRRAVITVTPDHVVLHDFETTIPKAVADLIAARGSVVASSASGLTLTELQEGWRDPARLVLEHPFNPPHLIPVRQQLPPLVGRPRFDALLATIVAASHGR